MKKYLILCATIFCVFFSTYKTATAEEISESTKEIQIDEGIYYISSFDNTDMVLEITNSSSYSGANVQLGTYNASSAQQFAILKKGSWYTIRNINSQCNLDAAGANPNPGANLQQCTANNHNAQSFKFYQDDNQSIYIKNKLGNYIDITDGLIAPGNNIQLFSFNNSISQKWKLTLVEETYSPLDLKNGIYAISPNDQTTLLSINNTTKIPGTKMVVSDKQKKIPSSQHYKIEKKADGWYSIQNVYSNLYLDIRLSSESPNYILEQWPGSQSHSQKFKFYQTPDNNIVIVSKYNTVVTLTDNLLQLEPFTASNNQLWDFNFLTN